MGTNKGLGDGMINKAYVINSISGILETHFIEVEKLKTKLNKVTEAAEVMGTLLMEQDPVYTSSLKAISDFERARDEG
jgi:hypothetical protein